MESLFEFEERKKHVHRQVYIDRYVCSIIHVKLLIKTFRVFWTDREGEAPDKTSYYPSMDYGIDANRTFELHDLLILTDNLEVSQTLLTRQCNRTENQYPCLVKGCYSAEDICDGKNDCDDGFDESDCVDETRVQQERTYRYNCYISIF